MAGEKEYCALRGSDDNAENKRFTKGFLEQLF